MPSTNLDNAKELLRELMALSARYQGALTITNTPEYVWKSANMDSIPHIKGTYESFKVIIPEYKTA